VRWKDLVNRLNLVEWKSCQDNYKTWLADRPPIFLPIRIPACCGGETAEPHCEREEPRGWGENNSGALHVPYEANAGLARDVFVPSFFWTAWTSKPISRPLHAVQQPRTTGLQKRFIMECRKRSDRWVRCGWSAGHQFSIFPL